MAVPVAAILYKLRTTYSSFKFEVQVNDKEGMFTVFVYKLSEKLGSKSFPLDTPMDKFWVEIKDWMRKIVR